MLPVDILGIEEIRTAKMFIAFGVISIELVVLIVTFTLSAPGFFSSKEKYRRNL